MERQSTAGNSFRQDATLVRRRKRWTYTTVLCVSGLLINYLLAHLATGLKLPLYLDNIGSALAAALGGYIPGIIVGFFTRGIEIILVLSIIIRVEFIGRIMSFLKGDVLKNLVLHPLF